jgi:acyl transferase domain-containing protein/thioesterase domain-containing protein
MSIDRENKVDYHSISAEAIQEIIEQARTEPIAIIGMDCRFPGRANSPETYWRLLHDGVDAIAEIPAHRWDVESYYDSNPDLPGKMYTNKGGFLDEVDKFDPLFFSISPLEAANMDPQQRLLLEVSYSALENAGQPIEKLKGSKTGVFVGICFDDYSKLSNNSGNPEQIDAYTSIGNAKSIAAGRLSYVFGFQGPNVSLDTSCSSSLLAIHLACQSLRSRESDLALAGGVNLMLSPEVTIGFCKLKALSPNGRCKTFDATADGYARGEGCGIVVLKRLSDAIANSDRIHAIIRASAANHDGQSNGLTAPNGLAQAAVISQALENAKVKPAQIQYVEAHGTATSLGDPIEVLALGKVFGKDKSKQNPLVIGSVKTNFGHLEGAAGVASLIKVVLSLQHKEIPPHLNFKEPNPYIPWNELPIVVPTELTPWHSDGQPRLAGVSSFGMSGTNAHIVLQEAPTFAPSSNSRPWQLLVVSAKTSSALDRATANLAEYLKQNPAIKIADVAYTLQVGRQAFKHRRMLVCKNSDDAATALQSLDPKRVFTCFQKSKEKSVVFMFSGQGTQHTNMGLELYQTEPVFRAQVERCSEVLQPLIGLDLREVLYPDAPSEEATQRLQKTAITQPALFVFEYALAKLWMKWGVHPQAMLGHSIGEYVAACLAGVFSLEDALSLVAARGQLMQQMPEGTMLAVALPEEKVQSLIEGWAKADNQEAQLSLAAINGPSQCVVSGSTKTVKAFHNQLLEQGVTCRCLNTSHAFHSFMTEPILEPFLEQVKKINLKPPQISFLSNVTGNWITQDEAIDPNYWTRHLRQAVRFADGVQQLLKKPERILLEVGSGQVLSKLAKQQTEMVDTLVLSSLPHFRPPKHIMSEGSEADQSLKLLLTTLGQLWLAGVPVDWSGFHSCEQRHRLPLPTYPFERQRYWINSLGIDNKQREFFDDKAQSKQVALLHSRPSNLQDTYVAPRNTLERLLVDILQENLGSEPIGIYDNFFELGGDSLLAIELGFRLSKTFQVRLNQSQLIETPTVAMLASIVEKTRISHQPTASSLVEIQPSGSKRPLFCIHPAGGNVFCYLNLARYLDSDQPIYGLEDPNLYDEEKSFNFQEKARYYIEQIQTVQSNGPYLLAGYSYGGNMAFEMAIQLKKQGQEVTLLAMLDSLPPVSYKNIALDDTKLLAAIWHMIGLMFDKQPRKWYEELQKVDVEQQLEYVLKQIQMDERGIALPESFLHTKALKVAMNNFRELHYNVPNEIYQGQLTYFWAKEKIPDSLNNLLNYQIPDDLLGDGWNKLSSKPTKTYYVPGHHFTMLNEPYFQVLAEQLKECLEQVQVCP